MLKSINKENFPEMKNLDIHTGRSHPGKGPGLPTVGHTLVKYSNFKDNEKCLEALRQKRSK
jgi:hypothetical protein